MNKFYLLPGKIFAAKEPTEITTILGSCVAVALSDPNRQIGGLNHYLLAGGGEPEHQIARYGCFAIPELVRQMKSFGADPKSLVAKIYGGASVLGDVSEGLDVGKKNIEHARSALKDLNIPIIDQHVGGQKGCRVVMNTATFAVRHQIFGSDEVSQDLSGLQKLHTLQRCRVLIVDDSATVRTLFQKIFTKHGLAVVGTAANAFEARELISRTKPDVITLDIEMPMMSGVAFLEKLMTHFPIPTVMVSSLGSQGEAALKALELGAVEFIQKPSQYDLGELQQLSEDLVAKVRAAANIKLVKRASRSTEPESAPVYAPSAVKLGAATAISVLAISGNSGAQKSLETIFSKLASDSPPVVVACSTVALFLAPWIKELSQKFHHLRFEKAMDGAVIKPGTVYFGSGEAHLKIRKMAANFHLEILSGKAVSSQIPSGTVLFESVATAAPGTGVGILLGGFGVDGVDGLKRLQECKCATVVENPQELSFPFAPQAAINKGYADEVLQAVEISDWILQTRNRKVA